MSTKITTTSHTQQQKLTKKQKKALAFRDKSNKSRSNITTGTEDKHELTQMADLHVPLMEESRRNRSAGDEVQMGDLEGKIEESTRGGGEEAYESPTGAPHVIPPKQKQRQRQGDLSQQESQWATTGGDDERDGKRPRQGKYAGEGERAGKGKHAGEGERTNEGKHTREGERTGKRKYTREGERTREEERSAKGERTRKEERSAKGERTGEEERTAQGERKTEKQGRKRKLDQLDDGLDEPGIEAGTAEKKNKKRKREKVEPRVDYPEEEREGEEEISEGGGEDKKRSGKGGEKQRLILFVGNLKYTTSIDVIKAHFSACDPPPEVRLLTPKASSTNKTTTKSKGCAFLEFTSRNALQQALKLHHSMLEGRMVNVELTAGGGGKGEKRMEKLRERNKSLLGQRKKRAEKADKTDGSFPSRPDRPQRYSATSGMDQSSPEKKRTWTVGDVADDEVHRGGQNHKKSTRARGSRKSKMKDWASGVNAIPVS